MKKNLHRLFTVSLIILLSAVFAKVQAQTINAGAVTGNISACQGTASASPNLQQFTVAGTGLTGNIIATAPTGFELSLASGTGYGGNVTLTQSGGVVSSTAVYVRSAATAPAGVISGNVVLASTGVSRQNVAVSGIVNVLATINTVPNITVNGGSQTGAVNFTGTAGAYTWVNNTPAIGLAASGTGHLPSFAAINNGSSPVTATITATPLSRGFAYITNRNSGTVSVINTITKTVVATIPVGLGIQGVAVSPDGSLVYVVQTQSPGTVSVINTFSNSVVATIPVGALPVGIAISPDGARVYVANHDDGTISVINTTTNTVTGIIFASPAGCYGVAVSLDGARLYVTNNRTNTVSVISLATNARLASIGVDAGASQITLSPDGNRAYVANFNYHTITVINTSNNTVTASINVGDGPNGVSISPDGTRLYVTNVYSTVMSVINTSDNSVIATIPVGLFAEYSQVDPASGLLYVTANDVVLVINTATNTVISTIPVGQAPMSFGNFFGGPGCSGVSVTFTITVNPAPRTIIAGTPDGIITACAGFASTSPNIQQFTVAGIGLSGDITATAPTGFEMSLSAASGYGGNVTLTQIAGKVDTTLIYVRSAATAPAGNISGNVVLASTGVSSQNVAVSGIVNEIPTINSVSNQTLNDGTATAAINFTGTGNTFNWVNDTPGIGLAASGTGNIPSFNALNAGSSPVTATITATPVKAGFAYITQGTESPGPSNISVINTLTNLLAATVVVGPGPSKIVAMPDGSSIYVTHQVYKNISIINTATNTETATIDLGAYYPRAIAFSPDGTRLYVAGATSANVGAVSVINTATNTIISTIPISSNSPTSITISPDGGKAYVTNYLSNIIAVINTATNSTSTITNTTYVKQLAISPDGSRLYLMGDINISVVNATTNELISATPIEKFPTSMVISPDGGKIYIVGPSFGSGMNTLSVFNTATNAVVVIPLGAAPENLSISPDGKLLYVSYTFSNLVNVISTATNTITGTITLSHSAGRIALVGGSDCSGASTTFNITVNNTLNNAALSSLVLSPGSPLIYTSSTLGVMNYTTGVDPSVSSVTLTPTIPYVGATITINGIPVSSGSASAPILLNTGPTAITTVVTAADGITTKTYSLIVNRTGSNNGTLASLLINTGSALILANATSNNVNYTTNVDPSVSNVTFTPTPQDVNATVMVNGVPVNNGSASEVIWLNSGPTLVTTVVTAADGSTTKTYLVTVNHTASNNATLGSLVMNPGSTLFLTNSNTTTVNYTTSVDPTVSSVTFTPSGLRTGATATINGAVVINGSASGAIPLNSGPTIVTTVVTAPDGVTTKTYYVTVNKVGSNNARLNELVLNPHSALALVSATPTNVEYTTIVPDTVGTVTLTAIASDPNAIVYINGSNASPATITLNVGDNLVTTVVTAQDGITTKTYNITITRPAALVGVVNKHSLSLPAVVGSLADNTQNDGITVHQGVSPNGDGIADVFTIDGITAYPDNKLTIVDRSGAPVFEATGYDNTSKVFNGRSNKTGAMQHAGTYYYLLEYRNKGQLKRKTGYLIIKY